MEKKKIERVNERVDWQLPNAVGEWLSWIVAGTVHGVIPIPSDQRPYK